MMWRNSGELLDSIHDAHSRLKRGETDAGVAHAEARLLGAATRVLAITLEHARLTGRLRDGSSSLPGLDLVDALPTETGTANPQLAAGREAI